MKPMPRKNDTASVFGLGRSGRALVTHLVRAGVRVYAFDDAPREALGDIPLWLSSLGVPLYAGGKAEARGTFVFRTPAMRPDHPTLCRAALRGAVVMGEAEYFAALCPCPILAVTGSDGKTTTSTMLAGLLASSGKRVYLGGNIGRSLLPFLDEMRADDLCVLELSSFQLSDMECTFHTGVVTNLTPNHLNWHRSLAEYESAKRRLPRLSERRVLRAGLFPEMDALRFSCDTDADFTLRDGVLYGLGLPLMRASDVRVEGKHNLENLLAAACAAAPYVTPAALRRFARAFGGAPHRMEKVAERDGVRYINSSIDTTPSRTAATVAAQRDKGRLLVLLGGRGKHLSYAPLCDALAASDARAFLFGEAEEEMACALGERGIPFARCGSMEGALDAAQGEATAGDTVLLSPAATSFDAFIDFEQRGDAFRALVNKKGNIEKG